MIMGIGVDMVSEARVARSIKRPGFLEKVADSCCALFGLPYLIKLHLESISERLR